MPDYYIRTPDHDESRGPFDPPKLQTLAEAGQITENTLYYDEAKEEWVPIALNKELKAEVFPQREKLSLKVHGEEEAAKDEPKEASGIHVEAMLAAAEGNTDEKRALKKKEASFQKAAALSCSGIGLMMIASAILLLVPHFSIITKAFESGAYATILNYPFVILGLFDFLMAIFLFLAVTQVFPLIRGRAMLTLGFGVYVGWSLGDPILVGLCAAGGLGIFVATLAQSYTIMLLAMLLGIGGNGYLAYLAIIGRFDEFFSGIQFNLIS
jgi:hypothetical protein